MEFHRLANCRLPRLKRLKLTLTAGAPAHIDRIHVEFLSHHPTIQDLVWFPIGNDLALPPGFLPNLKRLSTDVSLAEALYSSDMPDPSVRRTIECLNIRTIPPSLMHILEQTPHDDRASLRTLLIHALHRDDRLEQIPVLFPNIVHLRFPTSITGSRHYERYLFTMEGWLQLLPQFRHLQVFRGAGIWETLRQSTQGVTAAVVVDYSQVMASIARACPKLRQMDHVKVDEERGEHMRLVVSRGAFVADESATGGGADGEVRIKYQLQRPKQV